MKAYQTHPFSSTVGSQARARPAFVVLCFCGLAFACGDNGPYEPTKYDAVIMAEKFVLDVLRSPSTAGFPASSTEYDITYKGNNSWTIVGYVDAQNGFGAMIRSCLACTVSSKAGTKSWTGGAVLYNY